jgi:Protein of unknown function (DUF2919)
MLFYTPDDYNKYDVLNVPLSLVMVNLYLLKHYFIFAFPVMVQLPMISIVAQSLEQIIPSQNYSNGALLYSCIPALLVLVSMVRRVPSTGSFLRWVWQHGRRLLLLSLALEMGVISLSIGLHLQKLTEVSLAFLYIDMWLILFLLKSRHVKDVFTEFPQPK